MKFVKYKRIDRNRRVLKWFNWLRSEVDKSDTHRMVVVIWPYTHEDELKLRLVRRYFNADFDFFEKPTLAACFRDVMVKITITK